MSDSAAAPSAAEAPAGRPLLEIREELPAWQYWVLGAIPILLLLLGWFLVTLGEAEQRVISPTILPSPFEVVKSFPSLWFDKALTRNVLVSLGRVVKGFALGVAIAFPLGLLMGSFTKIGAMFNPLAVFGAYLPIPALVPLTMSLLGIGELQKVGFLALAFSIYLLPLIVGAVDKVDDVYLKTAFTLGASRLQIVTKVLLGISWADIYHSLRLGFGVGWSYILLVELIDSLQGVGSIITKAQRIGPREHIYLVLIVIVGLAFATDKLWAVAGRYLFPYRSEGRR